MTRLPHGLALLVEDLIEVINSEHDEDGIGATRDLYGLSDKALEVALEGTVEELNDALLDPGRRAQQFPELAEALDS